MYSLSLVTFSVIAYFKAETKLVMCLATFL